MMTFEAACEKAGVDFYDLFSSDEVLAQVYEIWRNELVKDYPFLNRRIFSLVTEKAMAIVTEIVEEDCACDFFDATNARVIEEIGYVAKLLDAYAVQI